MVHYRKQFLVLCNPQKQETAFPLWVY